MARNFVNTILVSEDEIAELMIQIPQEDRDVFRKASSDFFARFGLSHLLATGQFFQALDKGEAILHLCHRLNNDLYSRMHKGLMFYFMGIAAYRIHAFSLAIYYIDAAVSEDLRNEPENFKSPSKLFLRLEGEEDKQAAKELVQHAQGRIENLITLYNEKIQEYSLNFPQLSITDIRKYLLEPASVSMQPDTRSLATTFITFFLEFDYFYFQLMIRKEIGTNEPFFTHLFKGCLLFESLLKKNPKIKTNAGTLEKLLGDLSNSLGIPKQVKIGSATLENVLKEVQTADDSYISAIAITGKLRNTLGHNIGWTDHLTKEQYLHGFLLIATSCLHAISTLYRTDN